MRRIGDVTLRLAKGPVPHYDEILALTKSIIQVLEYEFGTKGVIERFANPLWFNAYACLVGFEWNYSGMTTVTLKAVKEALQDIDTGLIALGGKGRNARITEELDKIEIKDSLKDKLARISIASAKTDSSLIQDGYQLYFHFILSDEKGNFTVINQKMNVDDQLVRRFHWISSDFLNDPSIGFGAQRKTLNIASKEMQETREMVVELLQEKDARDIYSYIIRVSKGVSSVLSFIQNKEERKIFFQELPYYLRFPKRISLKALEIAKEADKFEDLLFKKEFGPGLARSLVYISHIIYGSPLSWKDPIIYTYAHGTKVGKPYYVKRKLMREEAEILENAIKEAKIGNSRKLRALRKLKELVKIE